MMSLKEAYKSLFFKLPRHIEIKREHLRKPTEKERIRYNGTGGSIFGKVENFRVFSQTRNYKLYD